MGGNLTATVNGNQDGLALSRSDGSTALGYTGLAAFDATGKKLAASLEVRDDGSGQELLIHVNTTGAQGTITIDPEVQAAGLTAAAPASGLGGAIAMSGNTLVAVGTLPGSNAGAVYVFTGSGSNWSQRATLTASDGTAGDGFGCAVAVSGNTVVVGAADAPVGGNAAQGAVYVFTEPAAGWTSMHETAKLTASAGAAGDHFGAAVAVAGNTVVAGAAAATVGGNAAQGAAYVFSEPAAGWTAMHETAKLTASAGAAGDHFGAAVATGGGTVVAGAEDATVGGSTAQGAAYAFTEPAAGWASTGIPTATLTAAAGGAGDHFGAAVAVSGNTVAVGAADAAVGGVRQGAAYVFTEPAAGWASVSPTAVLVRSAADEYFATGVAISGAWRRSRRKAAARPPRSLPPRRRPRSSRSRRRPRARWASARQSRSK